MRDVGSECPIGNNRGADIFLQKVVAPELGPDYTRGFAGRRADKAEENERATMVKYAKKLKSAHRLNQQEAKIDNRIGGF